MIILLTFLFIAAAVFCFVPIKENSSAFLILSIIAAACILIISTRGEGVDKDYISYKSLFTQQSFDLRIEPTFLLIKYLVLKLFDQRFIFVIVIYAALAVTLKFYGIIKISEFWFFSMLVYLSNIFIIQDMTQIRAGVCSALLLLSIIPLRNKNNAGFFALATLACLFHFSGLVIFLFWFLDTEKINRTIWALIIPVCYLAFLFHLNVSTLSRLIPIASVQAKLNVYFLLQNSVSEAKVNVFSALIAIRIVLVYLFLYKLEFLYTKNKYAIILIKIYLLSIGVIIIAADISTLAFRLNELLSITEVVVIPFLIYLFKPKFLGELAVFLFALMLVFFHIRAHTLLVF